MLGFIAKKIELFDYSFLVSADEVKCRRLKRRAENEKEIGFMAIGME